MKVPPPAACWWRGGQSSLSWKNINISKGLFVDYSLGKKVLLPLKECFLSSSLPPNMQHAVRRRTVNSVPVPVPSLEPWLAASFSRALQTVMFSNRCPHPRLEPPFVLHTTTSAMLLTANQNIFLTFQKLSTVLCHLAPKRPPWLALSPPQLYFCSSP